MAANSSVYNAAHHAANRDRRLQQMREWKAANRAANRASSAGWQANNAEASKALKAAYKRRHPERVAAANRRTTDAALAAHAARERTRRLGKEKPDSAVLEVYALARSVAPIDCHWCHWPSFKGARHVDHRTPLSGGGRHVASNLVIACATCNLRKGRRQPEQFAPGRAS
jgi:5-methylcytosine-specific restriction endonuclease McrA